MRSLLPLVIFVLFSLLSPTLALPSLAPRTLPLCSPDAPLSPSKKLDQGRTVYYSDKGQCAGCPAQHVYSKEKGVCVKTYPPCPTNLPLQPSTDPAHTLPDRTVHFYLFRGVEVYCAGCWEEGTVTAFDKEAKVCRRKGL